MSNDRKLFELLVSGFERDTIFLSYTDAGHPYYRAILAWGQIDRERVIGWLLEHIDDNWHWCGVLWELVPNEKGPTISDEMAGRGDVIEQAWLAWGRENGYLRA